MITQDLLHLSKISSLQCSKNNQQTIITVKCSGLNRAKQLCVNESCLQKRAFTCFNMTCKCQAEHEKCHKGDVSYVVKEIRQKETGPAMTEMKQQINEKFDDIIDQLSECRNNLLVKIIDNEDLIKRCFLTEPQRKFIEIVESEDEKSNQKVFTGKQGRKLWDLLKGKQKLNIKLFQDMRGELERFERRGAADIDTQGKNDLLERVGYQLKPNIFPKELILKVSSILKKQPQAETFLSFFPRKVIGIKLLFRTNQNQFSIEAYFKGYGHLPNTVFVCKTNKDKVIGAYSPLSHSYTGKGYQKQQTGEYQHDVSCESFIFSLTNAEKFEVKKQFRAIFRPLDDSYVCFGANELKIGQNKEKKAVGWTAVSKYYQNQKYRKTDPKFYQMLNGTEGEMFEIKEWQVWQLEMKS